jgi:hypothetical protein
MNERLSPGLAVLIGHAVVSVPAVLLLGITMFSFAALGHGTLTGGFFVGVVPAWLWWSFVVPRWRDWVVDHDLDVDAVQSIAVATGLLWPRGFFLEKTELRRRDGKKGW